jgi:hypothetical protein
MDNSAVAAAVRESMSHCTPTGASRRYCVWGSSLGWLVLYGAITYGWPSASVELLSTLAQEAAALPPELGMQGEQVWPLLRLWVLRIIVS